MTLRKCALPLSAALVAGLVLAGGVFAFTRDDSLPAAGTAAQTLAAFGSTNPGNAVLPPTLASLAQSGAANIPNSQFEGAWSTDQARELAETDSGVRLVAIPTDRGLVCYAILRAEAWGGGCVKDLLPERPIAFSIYDPDGPISGTPPIVGGIASPDVSTVRVLTGQEIATALVSPSGGFLAELKEPAHYPQTVEATMADGQVMRFPVPDPRPAMAKVNG